MKSFNTVVFFLINCFISHGIFAQGNMNSKELIGTASPSTESHYRRAITDNKPNCTEKLCIAKCCPEKQLLKIVETSVPSKKQSASSSNDTIKTNPGSFKGQLKSITRKRIVCVDHKEQLSTFPEVPVFNKDFYETDKKLNEHFNLVGPDVMNITNFSKTTPANIKLYNVYLMEDSTLVLEVPNRTPAIRWSYFDKSMYCIDYFSSTKTGTITAKYFLIPKKYVAQVSEDNYHLSAAMLVSCVFLSLVLVVYWMLPELRNLRGLVLMSYVASLLAGFAFFAVLNILSNFGQSPTAVCKTFSFVIYFCILSSFFWMNVMSLDIWWTFRGFAKIRLIHRRGEWFKYLVYCFYAWGVPLLMTGALIVVNETDMRRLPWFVTPQIARTGCFISAISRLLYLYVPMMIVLAMNCVFFVMTVFNMWRLSRGHEVLTRAAVAAGTPAAHISNRNRFIVYLKLSAVMGVNWILEVVSSLQPDWPIWYITDIYNLVTGFIIFFIFVCKKKIWKMLLKRYSRQPWNNRTPWFLRFGTIHEPPTSVTDSDVSLETLPHTVSFNTRGDGADKK